jgi:glutathione S-transferase
LITLYYAPDNASLVVRMVLEALGLKYKTVLVDRSLEQHRSAEYLTLNPNGQIPTCVVDNETLFETAAIVLHLADSYSTEGGALYRPEQSRRGDYLKWLFYVSNNVHTQLQPLFYAERYIPASPELLEAHKSKTTERILSALTVLNAALAKNSSTYLFSRTPSIVDIYLAVCCRWMQLYPECTAPHLNVAVFPNIQSMLEALQSEAFVAKACVEEGIASPEFVAPSYANPREGSAT